MKVRDDSADRDDWDDDGTWVTRKQAAAIAGVNIRTIDRWLRTPEMGLKIHRRGGVGSSVFIRRAELEDLLRPTTSRFEQ